MHRILWATALVGSCATAFAADPPTKSDQVVVPEVDRRDISVP